MLPPVIPDAERHGGAMLRMDAEAIRDLAAGACALFTSPRKNGELAWILGFAAARWHGHAFSRLPTSGSQVESVT
jgi:hypothetical protein